MDTSQSPNEKNFPLREEFLNHLRSHSGSDISECYRHLFICMEAENLENTLKYLQTQMDDENWFYSFHKSMRQTDYFNEIYVTYYENEQTDKDLQRMDELKKILVMYKGVVWDQIPDSEKCRKLNLEKELDEYRSIRRKASVEKRRSISGNLDMVIWNLVHLDKDDFLKRVIEGFFKVQSIHGSHRN